MTNHDHRLLATNLSAETFSDLHHHKGSGGEAVVVLGAHVEDAADAHIVLDAFHLAADFIPIVAGLGQGLIQHLDGVVGIASEAGDRGPLEFGLVLIRVFLADRLLRVGIRKLGETPSLPAGKMMPSPASPASSMNFLDAAPWLWIRGNCRPNCFMFLATRAGAGPTPQQITAWTGRLRTW